MLHMAHKPANNKRRSVAEGCIDWAGEAIRNPFRIFNSKQLAAIHCKSQDWVLAVWRAGCKRGRPEWILQFLVDTKEDILVRKGIVDAEEKSSGDGKPAA